MYHRAGAGASSSSAYMVVAVLTSISMYARNHHAVSAAIMAAYHLACWALCSKSGVMPNLIIINRALWLMSLGGAAGKMKAMRRARAKISIYHRHVANLHLSSEKYEGKCHNRRRVAAHFSIAHSRVAAESESASGRNASRRHVISLQIRACRHRRIFTRRHFGVRMRHFSNRKLRM